MSEAPPPPDLHTTDPLLLEERVAYDSYFDADGNPVDYDTALTTMAEVATGNMPYSRAIHGQEATAANPGDGHLLSEVQRESEARRALAVTYGNRYAAHPIRYHEARTNLANGAGTPEELSLISHVLDGRPPALINPYDRPANELTPGGTPSSENMPPYNAEFCRTLNRVIEVANDTELEGDAWTAARDEAAGVLREALNRDPSQIVLVQNALIRLERHASEATDALQTAHTGYARTTGKHEGAERRWFTDAPEHAEPPKGIEPIPPPPASASHEQKGEYYDEQLKRLLKEVKRRPGAAAQRREISRYVAEIRDGAVNTALCLGQAALAQSVALTGHNGLKNRKIGDTYETQRLSNFGEILDGIHELGPDSDPDELQERFGRLEDPRDIESFREDIEDALLAWRRSSDPRFEQELFGRIHNTRSYLLAVRSTLDTMSPYNNRYARLHGIHGTLSQIHNVAAYQLMQQRHRNAVTNGNDFEGRSRVNYLPDMGLCQEDGTGDVYYPDGSTAYLTRSGRPGSRVDAEGNPWQAPEPVAQQRRSLKARIMGRHGENGTGPEPGTKEELGTQYSVVADEAFLEPTSGNRERAQRFAVAVLEEAQAEADDARAESVKTGDPYHDDPVVRSYINRYTYASLYHSFEPGAMPTAFQPRIIANGAIELPNETFYGTEGRWRLWPNGATQRLDSAGSVVQEYHPDGRRV